MMSQKNSAKQRGHHILLLLLIIFLFFLIVQPVNKYEKNPLLPLESTIVDSNEPLEEQSADPNRPEHKHKAFKERIKERLNMVASQIQARDVKDPNVLEAMRIVPRHAFVRETEKRKAYIDSALPIEHKQTISQPYIVGFMTQTLGLDPNSKVLEIGTGSGYQAAVCAEIAKDVYTIEIIEGLAKIAKERLKELGYKNVFVKYGDGYFGWEEHAPYDAIIGTAAAGRVPQPLIDQLKPLGRMIIPIQNSRGYQELELITKDKEGKIKRERVLGVRFVPMTGEVQKTATDKSK
jgi:protein-L-isoaspartate(D-aspartate) O-methyltransferase